MNVCAPFREMTIVFATYIKCVSVVCVSVCIACTVHVFCARLCNKLFNGIE